MSSELKHYTSKVLTICNINDIEELIIYVGIVKRLDNLLVKIKN